MLVLSTRSYLCRPHFRSPQPDLVDPRSESPSTSQTPPQDMDGLKILLYPRENLDFWGCRSFTWAPRWRVEGRLARPPPSGGEGRAADGAAAPRWRRRSRMVSCSARRAHMQVRPLALALQHRARASTAFVLVRLHSALKEHACTGVV